MYVSLQEGLYDLCRLRIEKDEEFKAQSARGNFDAVDDALFDEYKLWQLKKTVRRVRTRARSTAASLRRRGSRRTTSTALRT